MRRPCPHARLPGAVLPGAVLLGTLVLAAVPAAAADRALLIGVGQYADSSANLPGIDIDIDQMQALARALGFAEIETLTDGQATLDQVVAKVQGWLIQGTTADDRVLLYFSGHGSRIPDENGDEPDALDEVLAMHDLKRARRNGHETLEGVLVDDRLGELLAQIPSRKVLVLVDACHSGTADKRLEPIDDRALSAETGVPKFYWYPGMPQAAPAKDPAMADGPGPGNYVMIAAARDDETSRATPTGSLFTLALVEAFSTGEPGRLTPDQVTHQAGAGLRGRFHPQLQGSPVLAAEPIGKGPAVPPAVVPPVAAPPAAAGPAWRALATATARMTPLVLNTNATRFRPGALLQITVEVPKDGYLNVLYVDERDRPTMIFPNASEPENRVTAGTLRIPNERMAFDLPASGAGPNLIVAIWSAAPRNLLEAAAGGTETLFRALSVKEVTDYARAFDFRPRSPAEPGLSAGTRVVEVCDGC